MATMNPFDLLGDDDAEDPSQLIAAQQQKPAAPSKKAPAQAQLTNTAKLPSKPLSPAEAMRETKNEGGRGGRGRGYGGSRSSGFNRDFASNEDSFNKTGSATDQGYHGDGETGRTFERYGSGGPRGPYRGGRRGGFNSGERDGERPRRVFERRSGTGRGNEIKREGGGSGNWGTQLDELAHETDEVVTETGKNVGDEKPIWEGDQAEVIKENPDKESEEKEPEPKEMTLEEYEKVLEEKRKALQALKTEERKVDTKEFESLQQLSSKKDSADIFIKLGSEKDKKKETFEKEEKAKKSVSINEFLKPAEGKRFYNPGGRGHGRGGSRGGYGGEGFGSSNTGSRAAPSIEDPGQFPTLSAK